MRISVEYQYDLKVKLPFGDDWNQQKDGYYRLDSWIVYCGEDHIKKTNRCWGGTNQEYTTGIN